MESIPQNPLLILILIFLSIFSAVNPSRQFSQANNAKRRSDVNAILNATHQYAADNNGVLPGVITSSPSPISSIGADICPFLLTDYMAGLPRDPAVDSGGAITDCNKPYDTGYTISRSITNNRVTVSAPRAELSDVISVTR